MGCPRQTHRLVAPTYTSRLGIGASRRISTRSAPSEERSSCCTSNLERSKQDATCSSRRCQIETASTSLGSLPVDAAVQMLGKPQKEPGEHHSHKRFLAQHRLLARIENGRLNFRNLGQCKQGKRWSYAGKLTRQATNHQTTKAS